MCIHNRICENCWFYDRAKNWVDMRGWCEADEELMKELPSDCKKFKERIQEFYVGDKVWFAEEKKPYKVRACNWRFLVCTKPYNFRPETVIYTVVDLVKGIRGTDGYVFSPYSYWTDEDCQNLLKDLEQDETRVSHRNKVELHITRHVKLHK